MVREDFYTGEPVITGSPTNFTNPNMITNDEVEAANMASFARSKYDLDPGARSPITPIAGNTIYPGYYGYNQFGCQQPMGMGIGAPPQYYSPYGNIQPTYGQYYNGGYYNPYYYQQQQPQPQQLVYHINGVGNSGEYLPPLDYQEKIDKLQMEYWAKQQELEAKNSVDLQNSVYGNGYYNGFNYYGTPYYTNSYQYSQLNSELMNQIRQIQDEARQNRMNFQLQMSRLAHNIARENISDEDIRERYEGKDIEVPVGIMPSIQDYQQQLRFANMVPFDNSQYYRDFHSKVSREFHEIVPEDSNLKDTFANMGIVAAQWEMEEEMHRRRDGGALYNSSDNSYKYFVRKAAQQRYAREKGINIDSSNIDSININQMRQDYANSLPTLKGATLSDDGTLTLPCNFGSHMGQNYSVHNSQESEYDQKRERFGRFLDSIPGNIYLDTQKQTKMEGYSYG